MNILLQNIISWQHCKEAIKQFSDQKLVSKKSNEEALWLRHERFKTHIDQIPNEILSLILKHLKTSTDFVNCFNTCKKWRLVIQIPSLQRQPKCKYFLEDVKLVIHYSDPNVLFCRPMAYFSTTFVWYLP